MISREESVVRERVAIRCARAMMLLRSLASSRDLTTTTIDSAGEGHGEIEELKKKLAMEKKMRDRIKLCGFMELLLLVVLVLLLSTFFLLFFIGSLLC